MLPVFVHRGKKQSVDDQSAGVVKKNSAGMNCCPLFRMLCSGVGVLLVKNLFHAIISLQNY